MTTDKENFSSSDNQTPTVSPGTYSPVTVNVREAVGTIFLGVLAVTLLVEWKRSEARYRALIVKSNISE